MPLLRKKTFQRLHVSWDFKDDDEVFLCQVTNEIFKDYNEFCERIILCNSLIWSCGITGRANMTYEEALHCEENAKKSLKEFPMELRIPILYLASKTNKTAFTDMLEDVFQFARERYFVGEMVEASFTEDSWCDCHVLQVIEPSEPQITAYTKENKNTQEMFHPPAKLFRYEVEQLDCGDSDSSQLMILEATQVRRKKQHYSRERNKIFLRQLCEQASQGVWVVKESVLQKYGINKIRFDTIFAGPAPDFKIRTKKFVKHRQESLDKFLTSDVTKYKPFDKPDPLRKVNDSGGVVVKKKSNNKINGTLKGDLKAKAALEKRATREKEKALQRELKKEEKQKQLALAAYMKQWNKPREDLECEDLFQIPDAVPITCNIPNDNFGEVAMILEFLLFFKEELEVSTYFPNGLNLDLMEKALLTSDLSGPWSDLLQLLLSNIFKYQLDEEDEIQANATNLENDIGKYEGATSMVKAVKLATLASTWCQNYQGCKLSELTLDHVTLSEILRQHLLSSGGGTSEAATKWRYSQRGGHTNFDDPGLLLRLNESYILRILGHRNVCEFDLNDKLKIILCLMNQLLTFASVRDVIEERYEKLQHAKRELKSLLIAEQKREKEEKEKMKEREKEGKIEENQTKPIKKTRNSYEEEKKKEELQNKLIELRQAIKEDQIMSYLGSDRAYRRYWRLLSLPGLFVENDESGSGDCLSEGTPYQPELHNGEVNTYTYLKNKFEDEYSDKENSFKKAKRIQKKVSFAEKNGLKSPRKDTPKIDVEDLKKSLLLCSGDKDCPVHWKRCGPKWSFYGKPEDIDELINSLNKRGIRESELRNNILQDVATLKTLIEECPRQKLNSNMFKEPIKESSQNKISKKNKYENSNLNYPSDVMIDDVLESTLRDYILDFEDKIKVGCLGTLKVIDRETWRTAINQHTYDKQCDKLVHAGSEVTFDNVPHTIVDKVKNETKHTSRPGTPDSEPDSVNNIKTYRDPGKYLAPPGETELPINSKQQTAIKQMACAILQLSRSIEHKYMKKPLGNDDKDKKWSAEEAREKWEQSLMASTSWSQLFVHLSTLENSVAWGRSAFNAQCCICRRRRDAENMLLCDGCNKGHHLYCLKPKLNVVPEGDWFCLTCKPRKATPKEKKRKQFDDYLEEDTMLTKETRHNRARRIFESDNDDYNEEDEDEDEEENEDVYKMSDEEDLDKTLTVCTSCKQEGKLIYCESCPSCYHLKCIQPVLTRAPRGKWYCADCKEKRRPTKHDPMDDLTTTRSTRRTAKRAAETEIEEDKSTVKGNLAKLHELLADVKHHRDSWPFLSPVKKDEVPDYHEIIKNPMDFGTIRYKLGNGEYELLKQFFDDCKLVFLNCERYNEENSAVYKAGQRLSKYIEKRCKDLNMNSEDAEGNNSKRAKIELNKDVETDGNSDFEMDEDLVNCTEER